MSNNSRQTPGSCTDRFSPQYYFDSTIQPKPKPTRLRLNPELSPEQREMIEIKKNSIVNKLEITKNPNLYSFNEVLALNEYDNYIKQ